MNEKRGGALESVWLFHCAAYTWGPHKADLWLCGERRRSEANELFPKGEASVRSLCRRCQAEVGGVVALTTSATAASTSPWVWSNRWV